MRQSGRCLTLARNRGGLRPCVVTAFGEQACLGEETIMRVGSR